MVTIKVNKPKCIGCGNCAAVCNNFKMVNNKAKVKNSKPKEVGCNKRAKEDCPVNAITIN